MKLIVGLGNPGEKYINTRHNVGARVVKALAEANALSLRRKKYFSNFDEGRIGDENVILILPTTYMNLSGEAVISAVKDKDIICSDILVVSDDADLEIGSMRIRPSGSDGGHRGLRSIIDKLGTTSFARLRIGIGRAASLSEKKSGLKSHVLKAFNKDEAAKIAEIEKKALEAILCWLKEGMDKAMNKYNTKCL